MALFQLLLLHSYILAHLRANFKDYRLAHPQLDKDTARKNFYREWKDNSNN